MIIIILIIWEEIILILVILKKMKKYLTRTKNLMVYFIDNYLIIFVNSIKNIIYYIANI